MGKQKMTKAEFLAAYQAMAGEPAWTVEQQLVELDRIYRERENTPEHQSPFRDILIILALIVVILIIAVVVL